MIRCSICIVVEFLEKAPELTIRQGMGDTGQSQPLRPRKPDKPAIIQAVSQVHWSVLDNVKSPVVTISLSDDVVEANATSGEPVYGYATLRRKHMLGSPFVNFPCWLLVTADARNLPCYQTSSMQADEDLASRS